MIITLRKSARRLVPIAHWGATEGPIWGFANLLSNKGLAEPLGHEGNPIPEHGNPLSLPLHYRRESQRRGL